DVFYLINNLFAQGPPPLPGAGRYRLGTTGLWTSYERRGWASEYWNGQVIRQFFDNDAVVGSTVQAEVAKQLDVMAGMGVNAISFEIRATDTAPGFVFPQCNIDPAGGFP